MTPNTSSRVGTLAWAERSGGILSRRERIGLLGDATRLQMRILPAQTRALLGRTNPRAFSVDPDRLRVPDTMIAREAEALCAEVYTQACSTTACAATPGARSSLSETDWTTTPSFSM